MLTLRGAMPRESSARQRRAPTSTGSASTLRLSFDVQRSQNPGHNAARGPAMFYALRLPWEK
jgi:hypothetical protein